MQDNTTAAQGGRPSPAAGEVFVADSAVFRRWLDAEPDHELLTTVRVTIRAHDTPDAFHPMNHPFHIRGQRLVALAADGVARDNLVWGWRPSSDSASAPS